MKLGKLVVSILIGSLLAGTVFGRSFTPAPNWTYHTSGSIKYHLYTPTGLEAGKKYPLALGLHGCCWDNVDTSSSIGDPVSNSWHNYSYNQQIEPTFVIAPLTNDYTANTMVALCRSIIAANPIDTQRIMLGGFSMGATGSVRLLNAYPNFFAGAIIVANAGAACDAAMFNVPCWMGSGISDASYIQNTYNCVNGIRNSFGETGHAMYQTGVNPGYMIFPNTGHGDAMEGTFGLPGVMQWIYSRRNDGNHYPAIWFTQTSPAYYEVLPAATTSVTVTATALDNDGSVTKVEFYCDGVLKSTDNASPYSAVITGLTPGDHVILATAYDNGSSQGKAMDKTATATLKFGIKLIPTIATATLPGATAGVFLRDTLKVTGGNGPFAWKLATGSTLPAGLTISKAGRIEGIPTVAGAYTFSVTVTDTTAATDTRALSLNVNPAPAGALVITNIWKRSALGKFIPWVMRQREPYKTGGYGDPKGFYDVTPHAIFDGVVSTGGMDGCTFIRPPFLEGDVSNPGDTTQAFTEWVRFDVNVPAIVHVAYPMNKGNRTPAWLASRGFVKTTKLYRAYLQDFFDYTKEFPAGTVALGPNDGVHTGAGNHYLILVEPRDPVRVRTSGAHAPADGMTMRILAGRGVAVSGLSKTTQSVALLDTRGRTVARSSVVGRASVMLNTGILTAGTYLVRVEGAGSVSGMKAFLVK